jgi:hypothetical protein
MIKRHSKTIWILCEGETERRYFQNLRAIERKKYQVRPFVSQNKRADLLVKEAINFKNSKDFEEEDLIVCLFDRDNNSNKELGAAKIISEKENIQIFFSNPCFEVWILSHFEKCCGFEQKQLHSYLKDKYKLDTKKETELYEITMNKLSSAIERCKEMNKNIISKDIDLLSTHSNPSCQIHELIDLINSFN